MARHTTPTLLAALVVGGAGASLAHAAAPLTAAPGARVVTVSPVGTTASEPAIAVNPHEPHEVVAVGGRWAAYSIDAGGGDIPAGRAARRRPPAARRRFARLRRPRALVSFLPRDPEERPARLLGSRYRRKRHLGAALARRWQDLGSRSGRRESMEG